MKNRPIEVRFRRLGKHKANGGKVDGLAWGYDNDKTGRWEPSGLIEIDVRLKGIDLLDTVIHEMIHTHNPQMGEPEVKRQAREIAKVLWKMNYRRVEK